MLLAIVFHYGRRGSADKQTDMRPMCASASKISVEFHIRGQIVATELSAQSSRRVGRRRFVWIGAEVGGGGGPRARRWRSPMQLIKTHVNLREAWRVGVKRRRACSPRRRPPLAFASVINYIYESCNYLITSPLRLPLDGRSHRGAL
ncbi:hypothetical protein EYF80_014885 [Liparis tanakae]|uniref:Uncharacterized protein n=1 Tax=Liparis tanakae TaxID=230148 RepID=A0A4Z2IBE9_9TELE|nr:hypothetical protein EYF80_014885 [Liparis tanakae]